MNRSGVGDSSFVLTISLFYAQNHEMLIFDPVGVRLKEFTLGPTGDVKQFLVHPDGRKVLILTEKKLYYVEISESS